MILVLIARSSAAALHIVTYTTYVFQVAGNPTVVLSSFGPQIFSILASDV